MLISLKAREYGVFGIGISDNEQHRKCNDTSNKVVYMNNAGTMSPVS